MLNGLQFSEGIADDHDTIVRLSKDFGKRSWPGLTRTLKGNKSSVEMVGEG